MPQWIVISDVDDTVLGDAGALERLAAFVEAHRASLSLVYSSGRFVDSVQASIDEHGMPEPDWIIGGVGTQIRPVRAKPQTLDVSDKWHAELSKRFDVAEVEVLLSDLIQGGTLKRQPEAYLSPLKTSYFTGQPEVVAQVKSRLTEAGLNHQVVYSSNRDLDILSGAAGKHGSAAYLAGVLGLGADQVICCGDSGNDLSMLTAGFLSVIVSNHRPELASVEGPRIHRAEAAYADGVIEGVCRWTGLESALAEVSMRVS